MQIFLAPLLKYASSINSEVFDSSTEATIKPNMESCFVVLLLFLLNPDYVFYMKMHVEGLAASTDHQATEICSFTKDLLFLKSRPLLLSLHLVFFSLIFKVGFLVSDIIDIGNMLF